MDRRPWIVGVLVMFFALFGAASANGAVYVHDQWDWAGDETTDGMEHWQWSTTGSGDYQDLTAICQLPYATGCASPDDNRQLMSYIDQDEPLSAGSKGEWVYEVPGGPDTYIASAYFWWLHSGPAPLAPPSEPHSYYELTGSGGTVSSHLPAMNISEWDHKTLTGGAGATEFRFGLGTPSAQTTHPEKAAGLSQVNISLADNVDPVLDFSQLDVPSGWVNGSIDIPMGASDGGLGLLGVFAVGDTPVDPEGPFPAVYAYECDGGSDDPCPATMGSGFELDLDTTKLIDGENDLTMYAMDRTLNGVNTSADVPFELKVDNASPESGAAGSFYEAGGVMTEDTYSLDLELVDLHSGVASAEIKIDNVVIDSDSQSCPGGGCSLELQGVFDTDSYSNGTHTMEISTTDIAGNEAGGEFDFEVDR